MARRVGELAHLARRFAGSLRDRPPAPADAEWAYDELAPELFELWAAQAPRDRRHSIAVARAVLGDVGPSVPPWLGAAALCHDVGKAQARLGIVGRSVATALELVGVRRAPGRLGRYLTYADRGAAALDAAGAPAEVVGWAREHHLAPDRRSGVVDAQLARALERADRRAR